MHLALSMVYSGHGKKSLSGDVSDDEWAFVAPSLPLMTDCSVLSSLSPGDETVATGLSAPEPTGRRPQPKDAGWELLVERKGGLGVSPEGMMRGHTI